MKRRSFLSAIASLPVLGNIPPYFPAPVPVEPKVSLLRTSVYFNLNTTFTYGEIAPYESSDTVRVDISVEYDDGSIRNFICDNQTWHYETRQCESHVVIDKDIVIYQDMQQNLTAVCTFKNVKEVSSGN